MAMRILYVKSTMCICQFRRCVVVFSLPLALTLIGAKIPLFLIRNFMRLCKQPEKNHYGLSVWLANQQYYERRSAFGQYENGAQHITRQVSNRIQKGAIGRKRLVREWQSAADKVRVIKLYCSYFSRLA